MQFKILQENLTKVLSIVSPAVGGKADPLITHNIKLSVSGGILTASATNTAITISASTLAKVEEEGDCLVPPEFAKHIEGLNPAIVIEVTTVRKSVIIEAGEAKTSLPTADVGDLPRRPVLKAEPVCMVKAGELRGAIQRGAYTTLTEKYDLKPVLAGIEFMLSEFGLAIFSHNGSCAGVNRIPVQSTGYAEGWSGANVRAEGVLPLVSALAKEDFDAEVYIHQSRTGRHIGFVAGDLEYIATAQEQRHLPVIAEQLFGMRDGAKVHVNADRRALLSTMRLAKVTNPLVRLRITEDNVALAATSEGGVKHNNSLGDCHADGEMNIAINADLLIGALALFDCKSVTLGFTATLAPFTVIDTDREIPWVIGLSPLNVPDSAPLVSTRKPKETN